MGLQHIRPQYREADYCDERVMSVCLSARTFQEPSGRTSPNFLRTLLCMARCDKLCISGFVDDVTFGQEYIGKGRILKLTLHGNSGRGRSLMPIITSFITCRVSQLIQGTSQCGLSEK